MSCHNARFRFLSINNSYQETNHLTLLVPISNEERKLIKIIIFKLFLWYLKRFWGFLRLPDDASQRGAKLKIVDKFYFDTAFWNTQGGKSYSSLISYPLEKQDVKWICKSHSKDAVDVLWMFYPFCRCSIHKSLVSSISKQPARWFSTPGIQWPQCSLIVKLKTAGQ